VIYLGCNILRRKTADAQLALQAEIEFQKETILNQSKELAGAEVAFAVARATQAMVHDVRKPFSMIKPIMKILGDCKTAGELQEAMAELLPDLEIATSKTEAMLQDVLQIGSQSPPQFENVDPYRLVLQSFKETLWGVDKYDLTLNIEMQSQKMLNCDVFRIGRLLANLFINAIQAMGAKGQIWVKIHDSEKA
jgi:signal transduction histidine kinase